MKCGTRPLHIGMEQRNNQFMKTSINLPTPIPPEIKIGDICILKQDAKHDTDTELVVAYFEEGRSSNVFTGLVLHDKKNNYGVGKTMRDFSKPLFEPFIGVLTIDTR